jgi:hypothetical protein
MATVYYKGFSVARIDADGFRRAVPGVTIDVENITATGSLGTVTADAAGIVPEGSVTATAGDIVEFTHATYPGVFRMTLAADQESAYTDPANSVMTYVIEDLFTDSTEPVAADLYIQDLDNPDTKPKFLATVLAGVTNEIPYQSTITKNARLFLVSKDETGRYGKNQAAAGDLSQAEFTDVVITGT